MVEMVAALVLGPWVAGAGAQATLTNDWSYRETTHQFNLMDDPAEIAYWYDEEFEKTYIYVVGHITNTYGGTQLLVMRYNADNPALDQAFFRYPDDTVVTTTNKGTGIVVDFGDSGRIYVVGEATLNGTQDYVLFKLNNDLSSTGTNWPTLGNGTGVSYNGAGDDDDRGVDVGLIHLTGNPVRVVVTGTADQGGTSGQDIFTIAYDSADGSAEWSDSYNFVSGGQDTAVELSDYEVDENGVAVAGGTVAVCGTSWGGSSTQFDIVAIYYGFTGTRHWSHRYNGPTSGDDLATGIVARKDNNADGVFVCGTTPAYPASTGDSAYVVFARDATFAGDPYWGDTQNPIYPTWNPTDGADEAVDIAVGPGLVWVTGNVAEEGDSQTKDIGTVAFDLGDGDYVDSEITGEADPFDERAAAISIANGPSEQAYVGAWIHDPNNDPPYRLAVLKYAPTTSPVGITFQALGTDGGDGGENKARAARWIAFIPPGSSTWFNKVFIVGRSYADYSDFDFYTVRFGP